MLYKRQQCAFNFVHGQAFDRPAQEKIGIDRMRKDTGKQQGGRGGNDWEKDRRLTFLLALQTGLRSVRMTKRCDGVTKRSCTGMGYVYDGTAKRCRSSVLHLTGGR